ncbi:MAG: tol-pal system YbgF family protein [Halothece sp.]
MFEEIASAIAQQDYTTANQLIHTLKQEYPNHPWLLFYTAQVEEAQGNLDSARETYQTLLQDCTNRKLLWQSREALRRLQTSQSEQKEQAIAEALAQPGGKESATLILSAIPTEQKKQAAQTLAQIFQMDAYNARLQLPSRGWRLFRIGAMGELLYYSKVLQQAGIPCFCNPLNSLDTLNVFQVQYFRSEGETATARCSNNQGQEGTLSFQWSEVNQQVQGRVPIFEEIIKTNARGKRQSKTETLDYAQFCDLHLPQRQTILRLCDHQYQFQDSLDLTENIQKGETIRRNWAQLLNYLDEKMPNTLRWGDFTPFGESAIAFPQMLRRITSHIDLKRRYETCWDAAFQLYSGLIFFKGESDLRQP